jgi:hypothetical protein
MTQLRENKMVLIEPHYLPSIEYFCALLPFTEVMLEVNEHFSKQTFRNRSFISTANGKKILTVPLANRHGKLFTKDVVVEPGTQWRNNHWRTIESAYRKAPFFDHYSDELKNILYRGHEKLVDLNIELLSFCLRNIGLHRTISASVSYEQNPNSAISDYRSLISDKKPFMLRSFYRPIPYYQVFGNEFVSNVSVIDLLLCEGPQSMALIRASATKAEQIKPDQC